MGSISMNDLRVQFYLKILRYDMKDRIIIPCKQLNQSSLVNLPRKQEILSEHKDKSQEKNQNKNQILIGKISDLYYLELNNWHTITKQLEITIYFQICLLFASLDNSFRVAEIWKDNSIRKLSQYYYIKMKSGRNQNVDYILVNLMPHTSTPPSFAKAKQYKQLYSAAGRGKDDAQLKYALQFKTHIFKKYGSGVYLYFSLLKMLLFTFAIISFNSLPIFLSNFKGDGLKMYGQNSITKSLMRISLGNQRHEDYFRVLREQNVRADIFISQTTIIIIDILNSFIFFVFLIFWKIKSDKAVSQLISEDALPSYYTLHIKNLPNTYSQENIRQHFYKFGTDIAQVSTVYNYENVLTQVKRLINLVDQYQSSNPQKRIKIYQQLQKQLQKVRNSTRCKTLKPVASIVTFEDMIMRKKIRDLYRYKICPRELRMDGRMIKVTSCHTEPSSILWQNFHLHIKTEVRQSIVVALILISVLFVALVALFLINAHSTSMVEQQQAFSRSFDYSKDYSYQQAKELDTLQALFVFCSKLTYHNFTFQYYYFCSPYFSAYKQRFMNMIALSLLVVAINMVLNWIIVGLAHFRRYKTKTQKNRFLILNSFALNFINSALLILLIRVQIGGFSLSRLISKIISLPEDQFSIEPYPDFNRKWYINIGSQIVLIYAMSLIISPFIQIVVNWILAKCRSFRAKREKTQLKMNETLMDSQFDFQAFYSMLLNTCFFTMFYGNAIPLLYLLSIVAFFSLYIASFIVFRFFSCKPVMFDHSLNSVISRVMCIALLIHQLTSMLFLYTDDIFPLYVDRKDLNQGNRLLLKIQHGIHFLMLAIFLLVFTFNYNRACRSAKKYFYKYFNRKTVQTKEPRLFSQIFGAAATEVQSVSTQEMVHRARKSDYLSSYKMEDNPSYANISYALKILSIFEPYFSSNSLDARDSCSSITFNSKQMLKQEIERKKITKQIVYENSDEDSSDEKNNDQQMGNASDKESEIFEQRDTERPLSRYLSMSKDRP